jgi:hypothetical protein
MKNTRIKARSRRRKFLLIRFLQYCLRDGVAKICLGLYKIKVRWIALCFVVTLVSSHLSLSKRSLNLRLQGCSVQSKTIAQVGTRKLQLWTVSIFRMVYKRKERGNMSKNGINVHEKKYQLVSRNCWRDRGSEVLP